MPNDTRSLTRRHPAVSWLRDFFLTLALFAALWAPSIITGPM